MRRTLPVLFAMLLLPAVARAEPQTNEQRADRLFNDAMKLAEQHDYAGACPKLEESDRLDPALGTEFNLADCYEHLGRYASAWKLFRQVERGAKVAGKTQRADDARARAAAIEAKVGHVAIVAAPEDTIAIDGATVVRSDWGDVPLDAGTHAIDATAPGKRAWKGSVEAKDGARVEARVPPLEEIAGAPPPAAPAPQAERPVTPTPSSGPAPSDGSGQRTIALVVGGVGVLSLAVGTVAGLVSMGKHGDAQSACPDPKQCHDQAAADAWTSATTAGNVSTIAFVAGAALAATGAVLWLTAPHGVRAGASVGRAGATVTIGAVF